MVVGVVGSRRGAALSDVSSFLAALHASSPDAVVVSGGAAGVDKTAEQGWLALGGRVVSLRPTNLKNGTSDEWWVERWMIGNPIMGFKSGLEALRDVSFADFTSCAVYRDLLIAEYCDRLVAFEGTEVGSRRGRSPLQSDPPSSGTAITCGFAREQGKGTYVYTPKERFAA